MQLTVALFISLAFGLLTAPLPADSRQGGKVYQIGFLTTGSAKPFEVRLAALRRGLEELGYVEGKNIVIEERFANGDRKRLPVLAAELIRLKPDVIVVHGGSVALLVDRAVKEAGRNIPVVFAVSGAPVEEGSVASLARPGGNVTGLSDFHGELASKRLELLKEAAPSISRVAAEPGCSLQCGPIEGFPSSRTIPGPDTSSFDIWQSCRHDVLSQARALEQTTGGAKARGTGHFSCGASCQSGQSRVGIRGRLSTGITHTGIRLQQVNSLRVDEFARAFSTMAKSGVDGLLMANDAILNADRKRIAELAIEQRLPSVSHREQFAEAGGLMAYGTSLGDMWRRAAAHVDKILKGVKPGDIPVERPTKPSRRPFCIGQIE